MLFPGIEAYARHATRLHPRPGRPGVADSHIGGPVHWPASEPWPTCASHHHEAVPSPLVVVAQLSTVDIPDLIMPAGADLLHLLWCPNEHQERDYWGPAIALFWRRCADVRQALPAVPAPAVAEQIYLPRPCILHPERVVEYPDRQQLPADLAGQIRRWEDDLPDRDRAMSYQRHLSTAPGWKVGGWASWHTTDLAPMTCSGCGREMDFLLQVDSKEYDGGSAPRWRPIEERQLTGPTPPVRDTQEPTGIEVGRWGELRIFVCASCPDRPFRVDIQ